MASFEYDLYPTLMKAATDPALVKCVIGAAGTAKTSWAAIELLRHGFRIPPNAKGVRELRSLVVRQTFSQLTTSTTVSYRRMLGDLATINDSVPPKGYANLQLPDGTRIEWHIVFLSMDSEESRAKMLGFEPDNVHVDEVSTIEEEGTVMAIIRRLGRRSADAFMLMTTNGPLKSHWLYGWYSGARDSDFAMIEQYTGRKVLSAYRQPPALLRVLNEAGETIRWEPNPKAENIQNLASGYGYYYQMLASDEEDIKAFVEGEFADLKSGKVVYPGFKGMHVVHHQDKFLTNWSRTGGILCSQDYGRTPALLLALPRSDGGLTVFDEIVAEDMGSDTFWREKVLPTMAERYPGVYLTEGWDDPAGWDKRDNNELTAHGAAVEAGAPYMDLLNNRIPGRIAAVRTMLQTLTSAGVPMLQVTTNCPKLIKALQSTYIFKAIGKTGEVSTEPTKSHVDHCSDLANALEYLSLGYTNRFGGVAAMRQSVAAQAVPRDIQSLGSGSFVTRQMDGFGGLGG